MNTFNTSKASKRSSIKDVIAIDRNIEDFLTTIKSLISIKRDDEGEGLSWILDRVTSFMGDP